VCPFYGKFVRGGKWVVWIAPYLSIYTKRRFYALSPARVFYLIALIYYLRKPWSLRKSALKVALESWIGKKETVAWVFFNHFIYWHTWGLRNVLVYIWSARPPPPPPPTPLIIPAILMIRIEKTPRKNPRLGKIRKRVLLYFYIRSIMHVQVALWI